MNGLSAKDNVSLEVFKELFRLIGWGDENIQIIEQAKWEIESYLPVCISFQVPIEPLSRTNKPYVSYFGGLLNKVRNSQLVKQEIEHSENDLKIAKLEIETLRKQIEELNQYKVHYDLEFKLKHGKDDMVGG